MKKSSSKKRSAIWLFAGGPMQRPVAEKIKERGYTLILTDGSPECVLRSMADEFIHLDTFDIEKNIAKADELNEKYEIKAIFTSGADCHETVARVARHLGLPGIDPEISHTCRYKYETRAVLTKAGIPQPKFKVVKTHTEALEALREIGAPVALKPPNNSGSRGFSHIESEADLTKEVFERAVKNGTVGSAIIEELLIPVSGEIAEQSVETMWYDGKMTWLNWVDRLFRKDFDLIPGLWTESENPYKNTSWAVELAHINPAVHKESVRQAAEDMIRQAGIALGMDKQKGGHVLKADLMLTPDGPRIIELTPRLSGGWDSSWSTPRRGADFIGGMLGFALGEKLTPEYKKRYFTYHDEALFASMLAQVEIDAQDCIGRRFALGAAYDRTDSLREANKDLSAKKFIS
ncbi:MAG: hypothetical protein WC648_03655 [Candidatus Paceibacterota bacterium]|jgi:cysteine synthase A